VAQSTIATFQALFCDKPDCDTSSTAKQYSMDTKKSTRGRSCGSSPGLVQRRSWALWGWERTISCPCLQYENLWRIWRHSPIEVLPTMPLKCMTVSVLACAFRVYEVTEVYWADDV